MRSHFAPLLTSMLMVMSVGCTRGLPPAPPARQAAATPTQAALKIFPIPPDEDILRIHGFITRIENVNSMLREMKIHITTSRQQDAGRPLAVVSVNAVTTVLQVKQGQKNRVSVDAFAVGQHVEVALAGIIKPANPVQAYAVAVTILE